MKILIKITKDVLRRSAMCDSEVGRNCAVGLAIVEIFPTAWVGGSSIHIYDQVPDCVLVHECCSVCSLALPTAASTFIYRFDHSTPAERLLLPEFSFEIEVPQQLIDSIGIGEVYRILSESKTLELSQI